MTAFNTLPQSIPNPDCDSACPVIDRDKCAMNDSPDSVEAANDFARHARDSWSCTGVEVRLVGGTMVRHCVRYSVDSTPQG